VRAKGPWKFESLTGPPFSFLEHSHQICYKSIPSLTLRSRYCNLDFCVRVFFFHHRLALKPVRTYSAQKRRSRRFFIQIRFSHSDLSTTCQKILAEDGWFRCAIGQWEMISTGCTKPALRSLDYKARIGWQTAVRALGGPGSTRSARKTSSRQAPDPDSCQHR